MLRGDDVIGLVSSEDVIFMDPAVLATTAGALPDLGPETGRNPNVAHEPAFECSRAWALSWVNMWSSSATSSISPSSAGLSFPSLLHRISWRTRWTAASDGRN